MNSLPFPLDFNEKAQRMEPPKGTNLVFFFPLICLLSNSELLSPCPQQAGTATLCSCFEVPLACTSASRAATVLSLLPPSLGLHQAYLAELLTTILYPWLSQEKRGVKPAANSER